jgi:hypothetical protein
MFFVLKFELIGSNNVLAEGARKVYRGRRFGQGCCSVSHVVCAMQPSVIRVRSLCRNTAAFFESAGSLSGTHHMNTLLVFAFFTDTDLDQRFSNIFICFEL